MELGCIILQKNQLEQPQTSSCWDFMKASSFKLHQSLTPFPAPAPSLENSKEQGLKTPSFSSWLVFLVRPAPILGATESHLIGTKDPPITQEIPRDLGALCQELGSRTKH